MKRFAERTAKTQTPRRWKPTPGKRVDPVVSNWLEQNFGTWSDAQVKRAVKQIKKASGRELKV
jgi:hypothetical protein